MKRLLVLTLAVLLSISIFGRPRPNPAVIDKHVTDWVLDQLRDMGYTILPEVIVQDTLNRSKQKFSSRFETKGGRGMMMPNWANDSTWTPGQKKEWDDLYYNPKTDGKQMRHQKRQDVDAVVDTLVKENPDITVNYIYNDDPFFYSNRIGMFYHGGFNYWHYNPFFYDPWDFDFGWGWNPYYGYNYPYGFGYPYYNYGFGWNSYWGFGFGWNHSWYGNNWYNRGNWYSHNNNWNNGNYRRPEYGRRESYSTLTNTNIQRRTQPQERVITGRDGNRRPIYNNEKRAYYPAYDKPRLSERPPYNNSRINYAPRENTNRYQQNGVSIDRRSQQYRNTENRKGGTQSSTQTRTYSPPTRNYNSTPSRSNSNSSNFNQGSSRSYNSGSSNFSGSRSSGSSNFSSGGSSGGSRSSGGSSTGRR